MDPYNPEHYAIVFNPELRKDRAKIEEFILRDLVEASSEDPRNLQYQFDSLIKKLARSQAEVDLGLKDKLSGMETPRVDFDNGLSLQFFVYQPDDERYDARVLAKWLETPRSADKQDPLAAVLFREYVTRDMFEAGKPRFKENAAAILELLKMSAAAYEKGPQINLPKNRIQKIFKTIFKFSNRE